MEKSNILKFIAYTLVVLAVSFSQPSLAKYKDIVAGTAFKPLAPSEQQGRYAHEVMQNLWYGHYEKKNLDDELSQQIFNRYLKDLDPSRSFFIQSDLDEFKKQAKNIDNQIRDKDLRFAFKVYNRYQQRASERLSFMLKELATNAKKYDFKKSEKLLIDRKDEPWLKNQKQLDKLWKKRLKNALLNAIMDDKTLEKAIEQLTKRYQNQLNRIHQAKQQDAFGSFMNAIAHVFDPHSQYFSPRNTEDFNINMSLSLQGIGAVLQSEDEYTKVVRLVPAGPADKSGKLQAADKIIAVGQGKKGEMVDVVGWRLDEVVDLIRGKKGSTVRLKIIPANKKQSGSEIIAIVREEVKLEEQSAQKSIINIKKDGKNKRIGVIELPTFYIDFKGRMQNKPNYKSTTRDVKKLLKELKKENIDGLIIDLRNNGGGSLEEAISLTGLFIPKGPVVQVRDARGRVEILNDEDSNLYYKGPMAVMVNRLSASASEIFAGAIQDYGRGLVTGSNTFGKGTVQTLRGLTSGQLKLTQAKFYRISGKSTQHKGVQPDVLFPSLVDNEKIGESALEQALPWDYIKPAKFKPYGTITGLEGVKKKHEKRISNDPDFSYLLDQLAFFKEIRKQKYISLNLDERKQRDQKNDAKRLAIGNKKRKAKGEETFKTVEEMEEYLEKKAKEREQMKSKKAQSKDKESDKKEAEDEDPEALETARILMDYAA